MSASREELDRACFDGDTLVWVGPDSVREIRSIQVGDTVLSRCELTGEMAFKRVLGKYEGRGLEYAISFVSGPKHDARWGPHRSITFVTGEHPFWVQGKGWTPLRDLKRGDQLLSQYGDPTTVKNLRTPQEMAETFGDKLPFESTVYNLEVEDFGTYFVATVGVWVHNCNDSKR